VTRAPWRTSPRAVALTSFSDRQRVTDVLAAGATGYVLKDCRPEDLLAAVHTGNIFRRIGVTDRTSAALWAKDHL
jgi:DNA-binding NarL/FixJ family response regulator